MYQFIKNSLFPNQEIAAEKIHLPNGGAVINKVELIKDGSCMWPTGDFYRINGAIHPFDPNAYDINFQIGFPVEWNGRLLQVCGGGLDGNVTPVEMPVPGSFFGMPSIMTLGYAVFTSDGGHVQPPEKPFDCSWGLNDEAMENYAYKAIKRIHDLAYELARIAYGVIPENMYIAGGSNGGRECLKALEQYPEDYDGAVCLYPVQSFVAKVVFDCNYGNVLSELGDEAVIPAEKWVELHKKIIAFLDSADGAEDGLISDLSYAKAHRTEVRTMLSKELNEKQMAFLDTLSTPLCLPFPLEHGTSVMNEIPVYEGASLYEFMGGHPLLNFYGSGPEKRDTMSIAGADGIIRNMIMRDPSFDIRHMNYNDMKGALQKASKLFDISADSLDAFHAKGGKVLLAQGCADPLVPAYATIQFYERLHEHCGEALRDFLRFYLIPGYGHGFGGDYGMYTDFVSALDIWVNQGKAPENLVSLDCADQVNHRTRPAYEYPYYPVYNGKGDINKAESFRSERLGNLHIARENMK